MKNENKNNKDRQHHFLLLSHCNSAHGSDSELQPMPCLSKKVQFFKVLADLH